MKDRKSYFLRIVLFVIGCTISAIIGIIIGNKYVAFNGGSPIVGAKLLRIELLAVIVGLVITIVVYEVINLICSIVSKKVSKKKQ